MNKVVGHEITHVPDGTEFYDALQDAVIKYAQSKGEYDSRLKDITELYNKHDPDADPVKELTADLVGDYLFTDTEFINNLSTNHRNVFQKVYDEIKYLCKVATAGSKEARQLEKVKKAFEDAYRADGNVKASENADASIKYSLENGNKRKYNKRSRYSETDTLFLSWENGSAPVGEVKKFSRYGKIRYYEKTENGCVELSRSQYNERIGVDVEKNYGRAEREISEAYDYDASAQRRIVGDSNGYRDTSGNTAVFGQALRAEFPDDTAGSVSSTLGHDSRTDINQSEYNEEASENSGASSVTWSNDYAAIRNFMKDGGAEDIAPIGENVERQFSLANTKAIAPLPGDIYGKDIALPSALEDVAPIMEDISKSSVDRGVVFDYDSSINDTEGGVISNEQRAETRESFHGRANEKGYTVRERGKISCGYYPVTDKTGRAGRTEKALQELGIPVVIHKGLEANVDGVTRSIQGDATSLAGDAVYVWSSTLNWSLCRMSKAKPRS